MTEKTPVHVVVPRGALRLDRAHLVDDLLVPLRRQWARATSNASRFGVRFV